MGTLAADAKFRLNSLQVPRESHKVNLIVPVIYNHYQAGHFCNFTGEPINSSGRLGGRISQLLACFEKRESGCFQVLSADAVSSKDTMTSYKMVTSQVRQTLESIPLSQFPLFSSFLN